MLEIFLSHHVQSQKAHALIKMKYKYKSIIIIVCYHFEFLFGLINAINGWKKINRSIMLLMQNHICEGELTTFNKQMVTAVIHGS